MEDGQEVGHEEGVDAVQVVEAVLEAAAPHRDGEGPQSCEKWETHGTVLPKSDEEYNFILIFANFPK